MRNGRCSEVIATTPDDDADLRPKLQMLAEAPRFRFSDWAKTEVPNSVAGVYAIWRASELLYSRYRRQGNRPG